MPAAQHRKARPPSSQDPAAQRNRELAAIHMRLAELKSLGALDEDGYRAILKKDFGVDSSAKLDRPGRLGLLDVLRGRPRRSLYRERRTYWRGAGLRAGMASAEQLARIEELAARALTATDKATALRKFIFRMAGVSDLRWLTAEAAGKVIEALKRMAARR